MRKLVSSGSPFERQVGFSRAVRVGNIIEVAGTAPIGPDRKTVGVGDMYAQTKRCLEIIAQALAEAGAEPRHVVRTRLILTDMSRWSEAARAHGEMFADIRPVCTVMQVSRFIDPDWLVEIEASAVID
ncbi:MAG TPA: RidA family protein [Candidatus Binatia bacterium]|nr:RidA family protein [Candidatus Binatia bacterium]